MPRISRRDLFIGAAAGAAGGVAGLAGHRHFRRFKGASPTYAHSGEDVIAWIIFQHLKVDRPSYLDVGAWLPDAGNNTYLFYKLGSRGVLVEPNIGLIPELKAKRPGDTVLNIGIGLTELKEADYYCYTDSQLNTFDKELAEHRSAKSGVKSEKVVKIPLVPINRVIEEHFHGKAPDFLSTDVEGLDLPIMKTLDFQRCRPKTICAETISEDFKRVQPVWLQPSRDRKPLRYREEAHARRIVPGLAGARRAIIRSRG